MTKSLSPSVTRAFLNRAVMLLDGYEDYPLHEQWMEARRAFLDDLKAALGMSGTAEALAALKTEGQRMRSARNAEINRRFHAGATSRALAVEYDLTQQSIHFIAGPREPLGRVKEILASLDRGEHPTKIAQRLGISRQAVHEAKNRHRLRSVKRCSAVKSIESLLERALRLSSQEKL